MEDTPCTEGAECDLPAQLLAERQRREAVEERLGRPHPHGGGHGSQIVPPLPFSSGDFGFAKLEGLFFCTRRRSEFGVPRPPMLSGDEVPPP